MTDMPDMWSITQAVNRTGLARKYVYQLIASGQITYVRTGRKYLINAASLRDYLNGDQKNKSKLQQGN